MMNRCLSTQEEQQLLRCLASRSALEARRDHAWMRALRFSGCRVGEFSHVSVGAALMAIKTRQLFLPRETRKGGRRDHTVLVTEQLGQALRDLLAVREEQTGIPIERADRRGALVLNRYGLRLSVRSYQKRMQFWVREAGLQIEASPHWFRHTRAMRIMQCSTARDPRGIVQLALGHSDIKSTSIYTSPTREDLLQALEEADGPTRIRKRQAGRLFRAQYQPGRAS